MKHGKSGIALLLEGPPEDEDDEESEDAGEEDALKAFFRAGRAGDWAKAKEAMEQFLLACGVIDEEHIDEDHEIDGPMM